MASFQKSLTKPPYFSYHKTPLPHVNKFITISSLRTFQQFNKIRMLTSAGIVLSWTAVPFPLSPPLFVAKNGRTITGQCPRNLINFAVRVVYIYCCRIVGNIRAVFIARANWTTPSLPVFQWKSFKSPLCGLMTRAIFD